MNRAVLVRTVAAMSITCACACSGDDDSPTADLPAGWEGATRIEDFMQSECNGSPYDGPQETAVFSSTDGGIRAVYEPAHFRCAQPVAGFIKVGTNSADVLVQPVDMDPESIAKCDCLYSVELVFSVEPGRYQVTLYRRWDHRSGADDPLEIASETVEAQ